MTYVNDSKNETEFNIRFHSHYHFSLRMMIFTHHINRKEILDNERRKRIT